MSARAIIRKGDATSHGGKVLEGWEHTSLYGLPIAGLGHKVWCPKCKGNFPITEGAANHVFGSIGTALEGMLTACGATLIASQHTATVEYADDARSESLRDQGASSGQATGPGESFDRYFLLLDSATGKPLRRRRYAICLPDGSSLEGATDDQGHTKLCSASASHIVELVVFDDTPPIRRNWDQL
ncbi:PAAR domain-containing protein [Massilia rhizosphaerae]|uniref:PAAR domain-containing protein n=1 Tax=Massilia rhizosphaerae TaxID=2784389 RepID=UPI0018DBEDD5|nr:PAAR domain-containing protein [Massilia rhizosphaerae]